MPASSLARVKKMSLVGLLAAVSVVGSAFIVIPTPLARCAPVQHLINVLCAVLLGPRAGVTAAFIASTVRNLLGIGTLVAYPGSMCGALLSGLLYMKFRTLRAAFVGEVVGTGLIGSLLSYPVATLLLGSKGVAVFAFVVPFLVSTSVGSVAAVCLLMSLMRTQAFSWLSRK